MNRAMFSVLFALFFGVGNVFAEDVLVSQGDVSAVREYLFDKIVMPNSNARRMYSIRERARRGAHTCQSLSCTYSVYVDGIYKILKAQKGVRKCPVSTQVLEGEWINWSGVGYYESISLSIYKGKPSAHQFLVFKEKASDNLQDGFGGWHLKQCVIETREVVSSGGRFFNPGNDLTVVAFDHKHRRLTVLDGAYLVVFEKKD